eukprot:g3403.t1
MLLQLLSATPSSSRRVCVSFNKYNKTSFQQLFRYSTDNDYRLDFHDTKVAYQSKSTSDLLRALLVFRICTMTFLVRHSDQLLAYSKRFLGDNIVSAFFRPTFFRHFCAGVDEENIKPTVRHLNSFGVGGILDYAAEADLDSLPKGEENSILDLPENEPSSQSVARTYAYVDEMACDENVKIFEDCIKSVRNVSPEGFAAIKITALGNPKLLERVSQALNEIRHMFKRYDADRDGRLSYSEFRDAFKTDFVIENDSEVVEWYEQFSGTKTTNKDTTIDYVEWTNSMELTTLWNLIRKCRSKGPLADSALDSEECKLLETLLQRTDRLCTLAGDLGVRVMIDAEQTYFQPAIDHVVIKMQRKHNKPGKNPVKDRAVVYNTYQCYLKDSHERIKIDLDRSRKEGWQFAAKLVRGAYMVAERARAKEKNYEDPIHDTLQETHDSYNNAVEKLLSRSEVIEKGEPANIVVASHNQESVERTIDVMKRLGLTPGGRGVYFGQLLGMSDHLSFTLGKHGYKAYKYVPYGPVHEVIPYLVRRAQENSDIMQGVGIERRMLWKEIKRRGMNFFLMRKE